MKQEYRIGFRICVIVVVLESIFWLIWWLITGSLSTLRIIHQSLHISIGVTDLVLLPVLVIPVIWTWRHTIGQKENPMNGTLTVFLFFLTTLMSIAIGSGLAGALVIYLVVSLVSLMIVEIIYDFFE